MMDIGQSNSLADLAARIKSEHEGARAAVRRGIEHAMAAGDMLLEAKKLLKRGQWLPWLAEHCGIPERTASHYMRLARGRERIESEIGNVADLTVRGAVEFLAPAEEPEEIADWAAAISTKWHSLRPSLARLRSELMAAREKFDSDDAFKAWLQETFPDSQDPESLEARRLWEQILQDVLRLWPSAADITNDSECHLALAAFDYSFRKGSPRPWRDELPD